MYEGGDTSKKSEINHDVTFREGCNLQVTAVTSSFTEKRLQNNLFNIHTYIHIHTYINIITSRYDWQNHVFCQSIICYCAHDWNKFN